MSLNNALKQLVDEVDGALASAVVDLSSGLMLGVYHNVSYFTQAYVDAVAAAAVAMFRGRTISTIEKVMTAKHGVDMSRSLKEAQVTTEGTYHFMSLVTDKPDALLVMITNRSASVGKGWAALRLANSQISPLCP